MDLTTPERWILFNQARILEQLYPDEADRFQRLQTILTHGYTKHYDWETEFILYNELPPATADEVWDILEMFWRIHLARERIGEIEGVEEREVTFLGFDGNNEARHLNYANFIINELGRYPEQAGVGDDLNSHGPTLDRYRPMVDKWKQIGQDKDLSGDEVRQIAHAWKD